MIINHTYKFIFIKTKKTAGTSVEIALSKFCGKNDILTPIKKADEQVRNTLGYPGPQNCLIPLKFYSRSDCLTSLLERKRRKFYNHAGISLVKRSIDPAIWENYYKFTVERNPFDKAVSRYFWSTRETGTEKLNDFILNAPSELFSDWHLYTENDHVVVDQVILFENLQNEMESLSKKLNLPEVLELPLTKHSTRKDKKHYSELLNAEVRDRIETVCAKEIHSFGYSWYSGGT